MQPLGIQCCDLTLQGGDLLLLALQLHLALRSRPIPPPSPPRNQGPQQIHKSNVARLCVLGMGASFGAEVGQIAGLRLQLRCLAEQGAGQAQM
jgi:hypothetical protein